MFCIFSTNERLLGITEISDFNDSLDNFKVAIDIITLMSIWKANASLRFDEKSLL